MGNEHEIEIESAADVEQLIDDLAPYLQEREPLPKELLQRVILNLQVLQSVLEAIEEGALRMGGGE
jgi:hypothetical protein